MSEEPPAPQISPDGKFYWDGQRWVPMQASAPASVPASVPERQGLRQRLGMTGAWNSCVGYGCMFVALLFVVGVIGSLCSGKH